MPEPTCLWERDCFRRTGMRDLAASIRCTPNDAPVCALCAENFARMGVAHATKDRDQ